MTPEERDLIIDLFDRLATLEDAQRDPDAERLIREGLRQAVCATFMSGTVAAPLLPGTSGASIIRARQFSSLNRKQIYG